MPRACDVCAVRKTRCDGKSPCASCLASCFSCTRLRKRFKTGPKGPRQRTKQAILHIQQVHGDQDDPHHIRHGAEAAAPDDMGPKATQSETRGARSTSRLQPWDDVHSCVPEQGTGTHIEISSLRIYLEIYYRQLYGVWPIVDWESLAERLLNPIDRVAYSLATAVCAATLSQLHLSDDNGSVHLAEIPTVDPSVMAAESERIRAEMDYMEHPTLETIRTSFFLHVFYANLGKFAKSTLFLREAISCAHILGLHKDAYYEDLEPQSIQSNLRLTWLLYITDKGHAILNDIPATFQPSPTLPELTPEGKVTLLRGFCALCNLFRSFDDVDPGVLEARQAEALETIRSQLSQSHVLSTRCFSNDIQRADILVTDPWLRIVLWRKVIPYVDLTLEDSGQGLGILFPITVAYDLLSRLSTISQDTLEAHGPGMRSKLFEIATALADVITCAPGLAWSEATNGGPRDALRQLATSIASLRGPKDPIMQAILQEKLIMCGLDRPGLTRVIQDTDERRDVQIVQADNDTEQFGSTARSSGNDLEVNYEIRTSPLSKIMRLHSEQYRTLREIEPSQPTDSRSRSLGGLEDTLNGPIGIRQAAVIENFASPRDVDDLLSTLGSLNQDVLEQLQAAFDDS